MLKNMHQVSLEFITFYLLNIQNSYLIFKYEMVIFISHKLHFNSENHKLSPIFYFVLIIYSTKKLCAAVFEAFSNLCDN